MTIVLESTAACRRSPLVSFVLEELDVSYDVVLREPGHFEARYLTLGPLLRDGPFELLEQDAILRHLARAHGAGRLMPTSVEDLARIDRWMEVQATLRLAAARIGEARPGPPPPHALATLRRCLDALDAALEPSEHLVDRFSVADCPAVNLALLAHLDVDVTAWPRVAAWTKRVTARPAWARARARFAALTAEGAA